MARPNRLHDFATYNTLFTLSGIGQPDIDDKSFLTNPLMNVIARSSGIGKGSVRTGGVATRDPKDKKTLQDLKVALALAEQRKDPDYAEGIRIVDRAHDIFFENVNILSVPSPNNERNLADFSKMEFELVEPYGITFIEKVRAVAFRMGFKDYMDAPFLLTIEFAGYDNTGKVIQSIGKDNKKLQRKIPVFLTNVEFEVDQGGAKYFVTAVPFPDRAHDDSFKFPRTNKQLEVNSITDYIEQIENLLNFIQMKDEEASGSRSGPQYYDKYKFEIDPDLLQLIGDEIVVLDKSIHRTESVDKLSRKKTKKNNLNNLNKKKRLTKQEKIIQLQNEGKIQELPNGLFINLETSQIANSISDLVLDDRVDPVENYTVSESVQQVFQDNSGAGVDKDPINTSVGISINPQTSLVKNFEDVIRSSKFFQGLTNNFWTTFVPYASGSQMDESQVRMLINRDGQEKRLQKLIEKRPFVPWFKIKVNVRIATEKKIDPLTKMHPKEVKYSAVPCQIPVHKFLKAGQTVGKLNLEQQAVKKYNYLYTGDNVDVQNLKIFYKTAFYQRNVTGDPKTPQTDGQVEKDSKTTKFNIQSTAETEKHILGVRAYPSRLKGRSTADKISSLTPRSQEFYDYLTNPEADMLKIELEILGDPAYICQDMYTPGGDNTFDRPQGIDPNESFSETFECFNTDSFLPLIHLKYRLPTDLNENKGTMFFDENEREQDLFFSGMYHVARIESSINQNSFVQVLHCNRLLNQEEDHKPFVVKFYGTDTPYDPTGRTNPPSVA
jgi:hypothetical protein